jgi:REP element-mobilizing transposase RayT
MVDRREQRFGYIVDGRVVLNDAGHMVTIAWLSLEDRFPGIELDAMIVMPNHVHGILHIGVSNDRSDPSLSRVMQVFKSETAVSYGRGICEGRFRPVGRALWQRSFHDRILRDEIALEQARRYVADNPMAWQRAVDAGTERPDW